MFFVPQSIVVINTLKRQGDKLMELSNRLKDEKQTLLQQLYKLMTSKYFFVYYCFYMLAK